MRELGAGALEKTLTLSLAGDFGAVALLLVQNESLMQSPASGCPEMDVFRPKSEGGPLYGLEAEVVDKPLRNGLY